MDRAEPPMALLDQPLLFLISALQVLLRLLPEQDHGIGLVMVRALVQDQLLVLRHYRHRHQVSAELVHHKI
jgi:hypothetical protein